MLGSWSGIQWAAKGVQQATAATHAADTLEDAKKPP